MKYSDYLKNRELQREAENDAIRWVRNIDTIADEFHDTDEVTWRRRLALEIHYLRKELHRA